MRPDGRVAQDEFVNRWHWQAPPGWPPPPPGWSPGPGWSPEPSWPEPPEGWRWWQQTPRSRRERWGLGLVGVAAVMIGTLAALVVAAEVVSGSKGCGSVDPTDPANYSRITIVNDQPNDVIVNNCRGTYCTLTQPVRLAPGQRYADHAACGESGADMTSWQINADSGSVLGYIAVDSPRSKNSLIFRVSQASRSRRTPTPAG